MPAEAPLSALIAAALFGASTPLAKLMIGGGLDPWMLAGLLYLGSGLGLGALTVVHNSRGAPATEASLARADLPWLGLVVLLGGVAAPLLMMFGLARTPAAAASLLLNLEGLATMAIAWIAFRESVDRRLLLGALAILAGAVILSWRGGALDVGVGAFAIAGACVAWGLDNNLTRKLSAANPTQVAMIKGLAAGGVNLALALSRGAPLPSGPQAAAGAAIGFLGYGLSLVLYVRALRGLGAARTGAYFSTAPFLGAALAIVLLGEPATLQLGFAALLMAFGVWLHLTERHKHAHTHEATGHAHAHIHDEHHRHAHRAEDPPGEPHAHWHTHEPLTHSHAHYPDLHHRHRHSP